MKMAGFVSRLCNINVSSFSRSRRQSQRTENGETPTTENQFEMNHAYHQEVSATVAHTEVQNSVTSPNDVSALITY
jgi:hypothetical protein